MTTPSTSNNNMGSSGSSPTTATTIELENVNGVLQEALSLISCDVKSSCGGEVEDLPLYSGLEIDGQLIPFPLVECIASGIIRSSSSDGVIDPHCIIITHSEWDSHIDTLVRQVLEQLGCASSPGEIEAKLSHGSILSPSSKSSAPHPSCPLNSVATLEIHFPSYCQDGALVITDQSTRADTIYDFGQAKRTKQHMYHYAAYYSDVAHRTTAVTSGYRFCLCYALVWTGIRGAPTFASIYAVQCRRNRMLRDCLHTIGQCKHCARGILLQQPYGGGVRDTIWALKGEDRQLKMMLDGLNSDQQVAFFLVQYTKTQSLVAGIAQEDDSDGDDEDTGDTATAIDERITSLWYNAEGKKCPPLPLDPTLDIVCLNSTVRWGMHGALSTRLQMHGTLQQQTSHSFVLVATSAKYLFDFILSSSLDHALEYLEASTASDLQQDWVDQVLAKWQNSPRLAPPAFIFSRLAEIICRVNSMALCKRFLTVASSKSNEFCIWYDEKVMALIQTFGWTAIRQEFGPIVQENSKMALQLLLARVCGISDPVLRPIALDRWQALENEINGADDDDDDDDGRCHRPRRRPEFSWRMPEAESTDEELQAFLQSPVIEWTKTGFATERQAVEWCTEHCTTVLVGLFGRQYSVKGFVRGKTVRVVKTKEWYHEEIQSWTEKYSELRQWSQLLSGSQSYS